MTPLVTQRPRARLDLLEQFVYLGQQGNVELAERYFGAVQATCARLARQPRSGTHYGSRIPRLAKIRRAPVRGFSKHYVFYVPTSTGIDVVRVLHSARDIDRILGQEEET